MGQTPNIPCTDVPRGLTLSLGRTDQSKAEQNQSRAVRGGPIMSVFHPSPSPFKPHRHKASDLCPLCEQPIAQDLARRIEVRQQEQQRAALAQARAEVEAKVEQRIAAALAEANKAAEVAMLSKLADFEAKLVVAEQAQASAQKETAALRAAQDTAIELRVEERTATLRQEKDTAVLAERTRSFEETQTLRQKLEDLTRKL